MAKVGKDKPVLVITGSSGMLGAALTEEFTRDYCVIGLDIRKPDQPVEDSEFLECDLTDDESVGRALDSIRGKHGEEIASVVHLAAYYDFSGGASRMYRQLTVEGTRRLIRGLQDFDVEQFVYSSSLLVMKPVDEIRDRDELTEEAPTRAEWEYPESKLEAEQVLKEERGAIPVAVLRIAGVYTDECRSLPIGDHIRRIYEKELESFLFPGDKDHGQPFIHISDVVECFRKTVDKRNELNSWELFLISEPDTMSFDELQETLGELIHDREWPTLRIPKPVAKAGAWVKDKLPWEDPFIKPWMVDMADDDYTVEIERARRRLDWDPSRRLRDSLVQIIDFLKRDPEEFYRINNLELPESNKEKNSS